jgi:hypothetical protein
MQLLIKIGCCRAHCPQPPRVISINTQQDMETHRFFLILFLAILQSTLQIEQ